MSRCWPTPASAENASCAFGATRSATALADQNPMANAQSVSPRNGIFASLNLPRRIERQVADRRKIIKLRQKRSRERFEPRWTPGAVPRSAFPTPVGGRGVSCHDRALQHRLLGQVRDVPLVSRIKNLRPRAERTMRLRGWFSFWHDGLPLRRPRSFPRRPPPAFFLLLPWPAKSFRFPAPAA